MKNILILLLFVCTTHVVHPVSYAELKSDFKKNMYQKQSGLMGRQDHAAFLEPHLIEGEKTLTIARTALTIADASALEPYFDLLVKINTTMFFHLIKPSNRTQRSLQNKKEQLLAIIEHLKATWNIAHLEPKSELQKTIALFDNATRDYYNKLSYIARAKAKTWAAVTSVMR